MDQTEFWRLIGTIDRDALREGADEAAVQPLVQTLAERHEADIREFENLLAKCLYDLDGQAYADQAGDLVKDIQQAQKHGVERIALSDERAAARAAEAWTGGKVLEGAEGLVELITDTECDLVLNAVVGSAGLGPTVA